MSFAWTHRSILGYFLNSFRPFILSHSLLCSLIITPFFFLPPCFYSLSFLSFLSSHRFFLYSFPSLFFSCYFLGFCFVSFIHFFLSMFALFLFFFVSFFCLSLCSHSIILVFHSSFPFFPIFLCILILLPVLCFLSFRSFLLPYLSTQPSFIIYIFSLSFSIYLFHPPFVLHPPFLPHVASFIYLLSPSLSISPSFLFSSISALLFLLYFLLSYFFSVCRHTVFPLSSFPSFSFSL